jgi:hypothetical protein
MGRGLLPRAWLSTIGVLTAIVCLVYIVFLPPHLVHHLSESREHPAKCTIASYFERMQGVQTACSTPTPVRDVEILKRPGEPSDLPAPALTPAEARAPPQLVS